MTREFITRTYEKGDEKGIVDLLISSFPEWAATENPRDYWNWKYRDAPLGSSIRVAVSNEQVIGVGHEINLNIKVGSKILRSQYSDDYTTHPEFRGVGVYKRLNKAFYEKNSKLIEFEFWLSKNPIVIDYSKKSGESTRFKFPYLLTHLFRIKDIQTYIEAQTIKNKAVIKTGFNIFKALNKANNIMSTKTNVSKDITINEVNKFREIYDDFWGQIKDRHNFIIEKNAKFLNWRYNDPRGGSYIVREAKKGNKLLGFTVLQVRKTKDISEGYIIDIFNISESSEIYDALFEDSCNYFDEIGVNAVHLQLVDNHPLQKVAKRFGFIEPPGTSKAYIECFIQGFDKERKIMESSKPSQLHFGYGEYY